MVRATASLWNLLFAGRLTGCSCVVLAVGTFGRKIYDKSVSETALTHGFIEPAAVPLEDGSMLDHVELPERFAAFLEYRRAITASKAAQSLINRRQGLDVFLSRHVTAMEGATLDAWLVAFAAQASHLW